MSTPEDPFEALATLAGEVDLPAAPTVDELSGRVRARRTRRAGAIGALATVVVAVIAGVVAVSGGDDHAPVATIAPALSTDEVPAFTTTAEGWQRWPVDGVVNRAGEPAPVFRRSGTADAGGVVIVLGESIPCLDVSSCAIERPGSPGDLGFLAADGPLGDWPAVFVPSWTDDLHLGRNDDARLPRVDERLHFVGAENVEHVLAAVQEAHPAPDTVVLAGIGGGGVGALSHTPAVADAFPEARLVVLVDGMLVPGTDTFGSCVGRAARGLWGLRPGMPSADGATAAEVAQALTRAAPNARFVVIVHRGDQWLRRFLAVTRSCAGDQRLLDVAELERAIDATDAGVEHWRVAALPGRAHSVLDRPRTDPVTERVLQALGVLEER